MDVHGIRKRSLHEAERLGFATNPNLPVLESTLSVRPLEEVVDRSLALYVVVSTSFGFDGTLARSWLEREGLLEELSPVEKEFVQSRGGESDEIQCQVEALNAFAWALGFVQSMPFDQHCSDDLIAVFPDLKASAPSDSYRSGAHLRSSGEFIHALDLSYCLHWAVIDAHLDGRPIPGTGDPTTVIERRRALEWIMSDEEWDEISLDT